MPRMMSAPTTPSGLARTNPETCSGQVTREARGAVAEEPSSELSIAISVIPDARVEPRVGEIDQQVHDHEAEGDQEHEGLHHRDYCLLYTSDAADERSSVDLGGRRIIK